MLPTQNIIQKCEQALGQLERVSEKFSNKREGYSTETRLFCWVVYYPGCDLDSLVRSSVALRNIMSEALAQKEQVTLNSDHLGLLHTLNDHIKRAVGYGLSLGMLRDEWQHLILSKQHYELMQRLAQAMIPLYQFTQHFAEILKNCQGEFRMGANEFQCLVQKILSAQLPENAFAKTLADLESLNRSINTICQKSLDEFLVALEFAGAVKVRHGVFAGLAPRPIRDLQAIANQLRESDDSRDCVRLLAACTTHFGRNHTVTQCAKRLLGCYQSPATSYLREELEIDRNCSLEHYPPLRPLIAKR